MFMIFQINMIKKFLYYLIAYQKEKILKQLESFVFSPELYFDTTDHIYFYTNLCSPNRVLKLNRLNDKIYGKYMNVKFN